MGSCLMCGGGMDGAGEWDDYCPACVAGRREADARYQFEAAVEFALCELAPIGRGMPEPTEADYVVAGLFGDRLRGQFEESGALCSSLRAEWTVFVGGLS